MVISRILFAGFLENILGPYPAEGLSLLEVIGVATKTRNKANNPPTHCVSDLKVCIEEVSESGSSVEIAVVVILDVDSNIAASSVDTTPVAR
jgi:hypothetical protein